MFCPKCKSTNIIKNGSIHNGKQKYQCNDCSRQFVENPENVIPDQTKELIDKLLYEGLPLAGIARVTDVSQRWLQDYVNKKYENVEHKVDVKKSKKGS